MFLNLSLGNIFYEIEMVSVFVLLHLKYWLCANNIQKSTGGNCFHPIFLWPHMEFKRYTFTEAS